MNTNLDGLSPREVWEKFAEIARVPRPSRHEEAIRAYLVAEARTHGIACTVDDAGNVILRKPATPGMESRKGIILQAHMDMVPQKNGDKRFDFTKDPIEVRVDGEWVRADGTTLGADNGIGVAAILAVMESEDVVHGPLEALITATEETGVDGARGLKGGMLDGEILVNLDSETEGELYVGCAGGLDASVRMTYREDIVPEGYKAFWIAVGGLKGGHSGIDIHLGRGNANRILFRLLRKCERECGLRLASVDGGGLRNAIPREATATVVVPDAVSDVFRTLAAGLESVLKEEFRGVDDAVTVRITDARRPDSLIDPQSQRQLIRAVRGCPDGVIRMNPSMPGLVQTSLNLGILKADAEVLRAEYSVRSSVESEKDNLIAKLSALVELTGGDYVVTGDYPGWKYRVHSPLREKMVKLYAEMYGTEPKVEAIHAGLECGLLGSKITDLDCVSMGPDMKDIHTTEETLSISSTKRVWEYLVRVLETKD